MANHRGILMQSEDWQQQLSKQCQSLFLWWNRNDVFPPALIENQTCSCNRWNNTTFQWRNPSTPQGSSTRESRCLVQRILLVFDLMLLLLLRMLRWEDESLSEVQHRIWLPWASKELERQQERSIRRRPTWHRIFQPNVLRTKDCRENDFVDAVRDYLQWSVLEDNRKRMRQEPDLVFSETNRNLPDGQARKTLQLSNSSQRITRTSDTEEEVFLSRSSGFIDGQARTDSFLTFCGEVIATGIEKWTFSHSDFGFDLPMATDKLTLNEYKQRKPRNAQNATTLIEIDQLFVEKQFKRMSNWNNEHIELALSHKLKRTKLLLRIDCSIVYVDVDRSPEIDVRLRQFPIEVELRLVLRWSNFLWKRTFSLSSLSSSGYDMKCVDSN